MNFAIFRLQKHKSRAAIVGSSRHMTREAVTPNADPERADLNKVLVGDDTSPADLVEERLSDVKPPLRKNGVLAVEVFLGMSPEWAATATEDQIAKWARDSQAWLTRTFGDNNLVSLMLHRDETTPHLTGFVVPVDPASGKLNASRWLDGRTRLQEMQDSYADAMKKHGLVRGVSRSRATHTEVKEFYGALKSEVGTVKMPEIQKPPLLDRANWQKEEAERLRSAVKPQVEKLQAQARAGKLVAKELAETKQTLAATKSVADQVRDLPMAEVAERLGLERDPSDKNQWRDPEKRFRITLDGRKFYDHEASKGGGGAIDLAKHVLERDYKGTVAWLAGTVGPDRTTKAVAFNALAVAAETVKEASATEKVFALPSVETDRALVEGYIRGRGIDPTALRSMIGNTIVSDSRRNIGFVMHGAGGAVGMELKGTGSSPFTGLAPGSNREGAFSIRIGVDGGNVFQPRPAVLVESAIDALSYAWLHRGEGAMEVFSMAGSRTTLPAGIQSRVERSSEVIVAFDNDGPGKKASAGMLASLRAWFKKKISARFPVRKDWNDDVTGKGEPVGTKAAAPIVRKAPARAGSDVSR